MKDEREFANSDLRFAIENPQIGNRKSKIANLLLLIVILLSSFILKLNHLGHASLKPLDEAFHAVVARNMIKHPLWPTLNEGITIPTQPGDWQNGEIWLHKPPMALWQIVISFKSLGVSTFALRLPSAILSTLAVLLTYLIGARLLSPLAGLIAAGLQAFNPAIVGLVHGRIFSDHVDLSLLFWTELSIYFLVRAVDTLSTRDLILCGIAQGLAFLSKTYPALIVTGLAAVAWGLPGLRMNGRRVGIILLSMILTIAPWTIWALYHWPALYVRETLHVFQHLTQDIEDWAAPWDRLPFEHWVQAFHVFYPAVLAGVVFTIVQVKRTRDPKLWLLLAWAIGVAVPHLLATSKPPVGTLIGWPAMWLMLGLMVSRAVKGDGLALGAWLVSMISPLLLTSENFRAGGIGPNAPAAGQMLQMHTWVILHTAAALAAGLILMLLQTKDTQSKRDTTLYLKGRVPFGWSFGWLIALAVVAALLVPARQHVGRAYRFTVPPTDAVSFRSLAEFSRSLPSNVVLMVEEQVGAENKVIQFFADRTAYPVRPAQIESISRQIQRAGGFPILISPQGHELPLLFTDEPSRRSVYDARTN